MPGYARVYDTSVTHCLDCWVFDPDTDTWQQLPYTVPEAFDNSYLSDYFVCRDSLFCVAYTQSQDYLLSLSLHSGFSSIVTDCNFSGIYATLQNAVFIFIGEWDPPYMGVIEVLDPISGCSLPADAMILGRTASDGVTVNSVYSPCMINPTTMLFFYGRNLVVAFIDLEMLDERISTA
ncbi:hypothetical protein KIPB_005432 [Kipferlia bialata]|uniref:Kelch-type beta propeller n=1 Tax=Kipferlia bialata TaxID=797122 RepID=A0A391P2K5_9EUKA|nr:hypothetical protein KIPB_005432 [Kipferlia bialata]|eukprot:g5432.t1